LADETGIHRLSRHQRLLFLVGPGVEPRSGREETDSTLIENVNIFDGTNATLIEGNKIA